MPPGSAKSTYSSIIFPSWWFTQFPQSSVIIASHSAALATYFSRKVRILVEEKLPSLGFSVRTANRSLESWTTTEGGEFLAVGVHAGIAGRRADLIIIDDPIGSQVDAESQSRRDYLWEWFRADLVTRLRPGGRIAVVMTRWHVDDLSGRLMAQSGADWRAVRLPALAEAQDPLGRPIGAALWPEWEPLDALLRKRQEIGERMWAALFQQNPQPAVGRLFSVDRLETVNPGQDRTLIATVRGWDLAATAASQRNDPDWTVGVKLGLLADHRYIILDVVRLRGSPREVEDLIVSTARCDGSGVIISIPEDPGQAGKSQMAYLTRQLGGFVVLSTRETGSKATRAMPLASQMEAGNVLITEAFWNAILIDELRDFPFGRKDDQVDALVRAFMTICNIPRPVKSVQTTLFQR
ncbi:phage terminase large subunit [Rhodopila sp.]|uniref:phage terminase large subunit n=1 Tax=Rhodopila sp. TaxID=2480087 RepID=UPI002C0E920C|nr:phage terminase large subunit [Rhodopila sp.]HVZ09335.1 phage terminase large subunit [Rhodopila sp.]